MANADYKRCKNCGNVFYRNPSYSSTQWSNAKACSKKCAVTKRNIDLPSLSKMYCDGMSSTDLGKAFGISSTHVLRLLREFGVTIRQAPENKRLALSKQSTKAKMSSSATGRPLSESAKNKLRDRVGPKNHNWRAGMSLTEDGYLNFTSSKANGCNAGRSLHVVIAEWKYARSLKHGEHVHHIDGNKLNNEPNNLIIIKASDHLRLHLKGKKRGK